MDVNKSFAYAIENDDGKTFDNISSADVIILGPSRSGKTPLCYYLASLGLNAINIPLVPEVDQFYMIKDLDRSKMIGLIQDEEYLSKIRRERDKDLGITGVSKYSSLERVFFENEYAREMYSKLGILVISMYGKSIEEVSNSIVRYLQN